MLKARLISLFVLGVAAFSPPLLMVVDGLDAAATWSFLLWALLILLAFMTLRGRS